MVIKLKSCIKRRSEAHPETKKGQAALAIHRFVADLDSAKANEDVIDLGAPQRLRRKPPEQLFATPVRRPQPAYKPNPRLYPGVHQKTKRSRPSATVEANEKVARNRRRKRTFRRPVPNSRLYRPAPPRPTPPPAKPRAHWPPPAPLASFLDTASRAALKVSEQRRPTSAGRPTSSPVTATGRRLVVTLPGVAGGDAPAPYRPVSAHFRQREAGSTGSTQLAARRAGMELPAASRQSASPEDRSEGNETLSAPSEFLAEFLSAIMQRQYAEALKYCRLILQYEPNNSTARSFYPLLRHKLGVRSEAEAPRDNSSSESARSPRDLAPVPEPILPSLNRRAGMEPEADDSGSEEGSGFCGSQSSLELDSSEALANSSGSPSISLSHRAAEHTDSEAGASVGSLGSTASGASRGECARCRSRPPDDNGNEPSADTKRSHFDDLENDNAPAAGSHGLKRESSSLRRLRAQFACSIK